jgi:hypothetical protein
VTTTTLLKDEAGSAFNGLNPRLLNNGDGSKPGLSLDSEGLVLHPASGRVFVSDEYGPSVVR